jgi:CheY-like chemotaxis protein
MDRPLVLIVDDEPHIRYMLELKLSQGGWSVLTARHGNEGFELACAHRPDVIVADLQMPGLDGLALCRKLREDPATASIPVLMLTARGHRVGQDQLALTSVRCVIGKPFSPREVMERLAELAAAAAPRPGTPEAMNDDRPATRHRGAAAA